jgi:hypothetical protein
MLVNTLLGIWIDTVELDCKGERFDLNTWMLIYLEAILLAVTRSVVVLKT